MKNIIMLSCSLLLLISCKKEVAKQAAEEKITYENFGEKILAENALSSEQMLEKYEGLKQGDTIEVKFKSTIKEVCKKKGCWMSMQLSDDQETFVKFKGYAFFVPKNADNSEAIIAGRAYIDSISVDDLRHYAKDGGKSDAEIAQITASEVKYSFQADGVLIQK
jgi:hypothetical protein